MCILGFFVLTFICICYIICITDGFGKDEHDVKYVSPISTNFYFIRNIISDSFGGFNSSLEQPAKSSYLVGGYFVCYYNWIDYLLYFW